MPKRFVDSLPPLTYKLHPKDPLGVEYIPRGRLIAEFPKMMFAFLRSTKKKLIVGISFVLFFPNAIESDIVEPSSIHIFGKIKVSLCWLLFFRLI